MKAIRRSLKNDKDKSHESRSHHQSKPSLHHKSAIAIIPPKKVIKALYDYSPTNNNSRELAFEKGDFFHVISREDDTEWYEACNPLKPHAKGLVPVAFFEVVEKHQRQSSQSTNSGAAHDSGFSEKGLSAGLVDTMPASKPLVVSKPVMHSRGPSASSRVGAMVYGVVLYDFQAERPDELEAKAGEAIIVVAQSNPEWFVAKPIGRLGGPGLIPVSFISIRDTHTGEVVTDPAAAVKAAGVPRVEEWKRTAAEYKNSSISLGQINTPQIGGAQQITQGMDKMSIQNQPRQQPQLQQQQQQPRQQSRQQQQPPPSQRQPPQQEQLLAPIKASVPRYCFDHDTYWYIIEAQLSDGRWWELSRYYADFYDFQIALLEKFPAEAGNTGKPRTLPFMPGPVAHVTDAISNGRRENLDEYIKKIVALPAYIREDILVRKLFAPKQGHDYEIDPDVGDDDYRLSGHSLAHTQSRQSSGAASSQQSGPYGGNNMPPPPPTASQRSLNGTHQSRPSQSYGQNGMQMPPPPLHTQASNLTTNSTGTTGSSAPPAPTTAKPASGPTMKVKVEWANDILVLRTPENATFEDFKALVRNRVQVPPHVQIAMKYRDDMKGTTVPLTNDEELKTAMSQRNFRLVVETV